MKKLGTLVSLLLVFCILLKNAAFAQNEQHCKSTSDLVAVAHSDLSLHSFENVNDDDFYQFILSLVDPNIHLLMFGEQHWMQTINELGVNLFLTLSEQRNFRNLMLEYPYSYTSFINEFINLEPGKGDQILDLLNYSFDTKEEIEMLRKLQLWNHQHPDKSVKVLCFDFEQDFLFPIVHVILSYCRDLGDTTILHHVRKVQDVDRRLLYLIDSVSDKIPREYVNSQYFFLTKQYLINTIENLKSSFFAREVLQEKGSEAGFEEFMQIRTKRIISNLEDDRFFGKLIEYHKSVFWAGAQHVQFFRNRPRSSNEATYFRDKYKDKCFSLNLRTLGYCIPDQCYSNWQETELTSYNSLVGAYLDCFPAKIPDQYLLLESPDLVSMSCLKELQKRGKNSIGILQGKSKSMKKLWRKKEVGEEYLQFDLHLITRESSLFTPLDAH